MAIGVSLGYLNNQNLTSDKFIDNPFGDGKLYKTGDLCVFLPDGSINYIGRIDNQVKLRGFRIELGEIDSKILNYPGIKESITIINLNCICSYIVAENTVSIDDLKESLKKVLPTFMIPNFITRLESIPLNYNGKADRSKLPLPSFDLSEKKIVPARNEIDKLIIYELQKLLKINNISILDSFFGIGGDSLNAINLCTILSEKLKTSLTVKDIFDNPIIKDLSDYISYYKKEPIDHIINKAEESKSYPLSYAQRRIYYANTIAGKNSLVYNVCGGIIFDKKLDEVKVQSALNELIKLHSSFRTVFNIENGEISQSILENVSIKLEVETSSLDAQALVNSFPKAFDLSKAPLLRAKLIYLDNSSLLLLDTHHIIMDGTSLSIIFDDFCKLYEGKKVSSNSLKYVDYAVWEDDFIKSGKIHNYEDFWINRFKGKELTSLNLPYDYPISSVKSYNGDKISITLYENYFKKIEKIAKQNRISSYSILLSGLYILLYKYTMQNEITIGSPYSGRSFSEIQDLVGMFVNNMVLNNSINGNSTVHDFMMEIHKDVILSIENQPYPYELLQKNLNLGSNNPLLDVMFTYQNISKTKISIDGIAGKPLTSNTKTSKFNLWFEVIPMTYTFNLEYNTDLFKIETAESLLKHYIFILNEIINNQDCKIDDLSIITDEESSLLEKFNNTYMEISDDETIVSLFENQVRKTPEKIAVICNNVSLTYDELNKKANSLANYLINYGVKENDIVCIMTNRSLETIVSMLGILKAGAAFFNVDPTYPTDRTKYYIEDSKTDLVLTQKELIQSIEQIKHIIEIDLDNYEIYGNNYENPNIKVDKNSLSYIIYTSGSTGNPKGVCLNQIGFANMAKAMTYALNYLKDGKDHTIASVTSTPFDIFVYEIFVSLTHGMKIIMANNSEHRNPKLLDKLIRDNNVDVMTVTPSLMKINYDNREKDSALALVKNMVFGGEPLPQKFIDDLKSLSNDISITNIYGPSEITILSNVQNLDNEKEISVGPPIKNTQIHILDQNMKEVPIGVVGEIYISGIQVGLGYINKPELTSKVFLDNPFGNGKIYKSGDIGRWTFDGKVQILGRIDHQIKLRGLRIELRRN